MTINLGCLWLFREYMFSWIDSEGLRINISLFLAIFLATFNNYCWNRRWTWLDRKENAGKGFWKQMIEYYTVCLFAILLQVLFTNLLLRFMHYLPANLSAIVLAGFVNFLANDAWTFTSRRFLRKP